jgi:hypothetical protein
MRLRIFGVPKYILIAYGLFPLMLWSAFHLNSIYYHREEAFWAFGFGLLVCSIFTYSFRRGIFSIRYLIYAAITFEILVELLPSVLERDFATLGGTLLALLVSIGVGAWLEGKVGAAFLNPQATWFEGEPKVLPKVKARIRLGDAWIPAGLRRIDERGLFLLLDAGTNYKKGQKIEFELTYLGEPVQGEGKLRACFLGEKLGFGLQFYPKDLYHFNQYTTLVKRLRGEGL